MAQRIDRAHLRAAILVLPAAALLVIAIAAFLSALGSGTLAPRAPRAAARVAAPPEPREPPPPVEPIRYAELSPDAARAVNATVPYLPGPPPPARPYRFKGPVQERAAARTCLAAAVLYEAGDDRVGEQAVAQVVLNRLRHPAFPKTVCGVVFQGAERSTGCQFTFTCDGALARRPDPGAWKRAEEIADEALSGFVLERVGTATHYHTDWVVPYWHVGLSKIAKVGTHIFYRWQGWWGLPAAFSGRPQPGEQVHPSITHLADSVALAELDAMVEEGPQPARQSLAVEGVPRSALKGHVVRLKDEGAAQYVVQLDEGSDPGGWAVLGFTICGAKPDCLVMGWAGERGVPRALPVMPHQMRSIAFLYRKSSLIGRAQPTWDCTRYRRPLATQCIAG